MYEIISSILCLIGAIYLLYRISILLKNLLQLIWKPNNWKHKSTKEKISALCNCKASFFDDFD